MASNRSDNNKPIILKSKIIAKSRIFTIEELELEFTNGAKRYYERLHTRKAGAVVIVPMLTDDTFLLVNEYMAGFHRYELSLPKGLMDDGETALAAANRELKEEIGYGAQQLTPLTRLSSAPGIFRNQVEIVLARDLYPEKLPGDEPEPLDVIEWQLTRIPELLARDDFCHAISIAALFLAREKLAQ